MTYYEWVELFDLIKKKPRSDVYLQKLSAEETNYKGNAETLFVNHIVDIINTRLKRILNDFLNKSKTKTLNIEAFSIELNEIKKECEYLKKIISYNYVPVNKRTELQNYLNNSLIKVETAIKNSFDASVDSQIIILIKNFNLTEVNNELQ